MSCTEVGIMKKVAQQEAQAIYTTELGIVTAVFPHAEEDDKDNYQCSVILKNKVLADGNAFELRKVPIATPYLGLACIPNVNDLVLINFIGGNINAPVITGRLYTDDNRPPENKKNEFLLQHSLKEGGRIKLDAEGEVSLASKNTEEEKQSALSLNDEEIIIENKHLKVKITLSEKMILIEAEEGDCQIKAKNITLTADNDVTIKGKKITIKGDSIDLN